MSWFSVALHEIPQQKTHTELDRNIQATAQAAVATPAALPWILHPEMI